MVRLKLKVLWPFLIVGTIVGLAFSSAYLLVAHPVYQATSKAFVSAQAASSSSDLSAGGSYAQQIISSYADVATTPFILNRVISSLRLDTSASDLAERVSATAPNDTVILEISASDSSPAMAAAIANAVTRELSARAVSLSPEATQGEAGAVKITTVQMAVPPAHASSPRVLQVLGLGPIVGLTLGAVVGLLVDASRTKFRTAGELGDASGLPIMGEIPFMPTAAEVPVSGVGETDPTYAEAFNVARANLQFAGLHKPGQSFIITSSIPNEGKTTTAVNLAIALSESGQKVLLVEADLRRPRVTTLLGLDSSLGLSELLISATDLESALQVWGSAGLTVLPSGRLPPNPGDLLAGPQLRKLVDQLGERFDVVIYDAPPLLPVADGVVLARVVGAALLVAAMQRVKGQDLLLAVSKLAQVDVPVLGVIATMSRGVSASGYSYYGHRGG